jgi:hypothetical protein
MVKEAPYYRGPEIQLQVALNHPAHGSNNPETCLKIMNFWMDVAELGQEIDMLYCKNKRYARPAQ